MVHGPMSICIIILFLLLFYTELVQFLLVAGNKNLLWLK